MSRLQSVTDDLWVIPEPSFSLMGLRIGTRTTVVRLPEGGLWVHSPVALDDSLVADLADLGPIRHIVAPNAFHHIYIADWKRTYPEARLWGASGLLKKRRDIAFNAVLGRDEGAWPFRSEHVQGSRIDETVFLHEPSGTLINADLFQNFATCSHLPTRLYLQAGGVYGKPGMHWLVRTLTYTNRDTARASVERVLHWDFDKVVLAHGDLVLQDGKDVAERGLAWLTG